ncbi:hypothetical protein MAH1_04160 [Sessilibacter sp. MAH1]
MKYLRLFILALVASTFIGNTVSAEELQSTVAKKEIVELLPEDFKPAFTRETVIKLNAIVKRSFDAINDYDDSIREVRAVVADAMKPDATDDAKQIAMKKISHINDLMQASKSALMDMKAAEVELRNSGEEYNSAILAGMIDFVEDVAREISAQEKNLPSFSEQANS